MCTGVFVLCKIWGRKLFFFFLQFVFFVNMNTAMDKVQGEVNGTGQYEYIKFLGEGGFGVVAKVRNIKTNEELAVKVLSKQAVGHDMTLDNLLEKKKRILREILHHKRVTGHPLIVEFKEVFLTDSFICIVMEYAQGGNMFGYVTDCIINGTPLTEDEARGWFQQLVIGLRFCHEHNIVNRDVKLENTLRAYDLNGARPAWWAAPCKINTKSNHSWFLKLCDFGYSKDLEQNSAPTSRVGSLPYASPEVLYAEPGETYDGRKRDVWSVGVMLYCLLIGSYPFDPRKYATGTLFARIRDAIYAYPADFKGSQEVRQLIGALLKPNPEERYSLDDVINHPWFQIGLPKNWNQDFDQVVEDKQQVLQSDSEITSLIEKVFQETPFQLSNNYVDNSIELQLENDMQNV
eukprot:TRINITY_DN1047_c0_g2_i1.p1 TRINITY_DN1047_c0_g2~~TRINITY_DN1047_c0_g2_i1.p1  ORF type:complete len:422 (-),score=59.14 TRINITY_DN1047_c0_g2_i1:203-1414(-)